jgi:hypothetical protein
VGEEGDGGVGFVVGALATLPEFIAWRNAEDELENAKAAYSENHSYNPGDLERILARIRRAMVDVNRKWREFLGLKNGEDCDGLYKENTMKSNNKYAQDEKTKNRIDNTFRYHAPEGDQAERYVRIREHCKALALTLTTNCPPSRELSLALTHLEESCMWANASISRNE